VVKVVSTWGNQKAISGGMGRVFHFCLCNFSVENSVCAFVPVLHTTATMGVWGLNFLAVSYVEIYQSMRRISLSLKMFRS
jgi:hypothetical protein